MAKLDKNKECIGIDLGTTNTSATRSYLDANGYPHIGECQFTQGGQGDNKILPSIMYVDKEGKVLIGRDAKEAKKRPSQSPRFFENTKRDIGQGDAKIYSIDGEGYSPIDVATEILRTVAKSRQVKDCIKRNNYYVIITVPANFNSAQKENTKAAALRADLVSSEEQLKLMAEPKAAILGFLNQEESKQLNQKQLDLTKRKRILVIDLGGGTCDICVEDAEEIKVGESRRLNIDQQVVGRENLGGLDFDLRIREVLLSNTGLALERLSPLEQAQLLNVAQSLKEQLSTRINQAVEDLELDYKNKNWLLELQDAEIEPTIRSLKIGDDYYEFELTLEQLIGATKPLILNQDRDSYRVNSADRDANKNVEDLINRTLEDKKEEGEVIPTDSIDVIFLTGGMAWFFPLKAYLYEKYKKDIIIPDNPFLAVSNGASLYNKYDFTGNGDVLPNAIMLELETGEFYTLIKSQTPIPMEAEVKNDDGVTTHEFRTTSPNGIKINLYEGKNEYDCQLRRVMNPYIINFEKPVKLGTKFTVRYQIDESGCITFLIRVGEQEYCVNAQTQGGSKDEE